MTVKDRMLRLFGRPQALMQTKEALSVAASQDVKMAETDRLIVHRPGQPVWTPLRFDRLADEGYRLNPVVHKCVRLVAGATARLPWIVCRRAVPMDAHPLLSLLSQPAPGQSGQAMREALFGHLLIAGNAYLEAVAGQTGPVRGLHVLRPDRLKVIPSASGSISAWVMNVGGREHRFGARDLQGRSPILHLKMFNPLNDWYGMPPLEAAARAVDQHNEASAWNKALLQNMGRPSGALLVKGDTALSDDQFARLKSALETQYQSPENAGRPLLLEGGFEWQEMGLNARDLDWLRGKDMSAREIALVYQVPAQLIGIPDAQTYSNNREARLALYEDAVLPLADLFAESLTNWLAPFYGGDIRLSYDKDRIDALGPRRDRLYTRLSQADWLTKNEKRVATGFDPIEGGHDNPTDQRQAPAALQTTKQDA